MIRLRIASITFAALLALTAVTLVPNAAAYLPVCIERTVEQGPLTAHVGQCEPQYAELDLCPSWGSPERHIRQDVYDPRVAYVDVEWCTPHSPPPSSAGASDAGPCGFSQQRCPAPHFPGLDDLLAPACTTDLCPPFPPEPSPMKCPSQTVGSNVDHQNSLTLNNDCSLHLITGKGQICVGAWSGYEDRQVGPLRWERYYCEFPGGSPVCCLTTTAASAGLPDPCETQVFECTSPMEPNDPLQQAPPCTCPPPRPLCYEVNRAIAWNEQYSLSDNCRITVTVDEAECGLQGYQWTNTTVGVLTLNYHDCQSPPQQLAGSSTAMADPFPTCVRECTPPILDGCRLRAATPTTVGPFLLPFNPQQTVWGSDCDIDVDPIGACAPPSGSTIERDVLFLDVRLLVCDGGVGDDWS